MFYVKSILEIGELSKIAILTFLGILILVNFSLLKGQKKSSITIFRALKIVKMTVFEKTLRLISRKICVSQKFSDFHFVFKKLLILQKIV